MRGAGPPPPGGIALPPRRSLASSLGRRSNEEEEGAAVAPAPGEGVVTSVGTGGGGVAIEEDDEGLKSAYLAELGIDEARSRDDLLLPPLPPPPMRVESRLPRPRFSLVERASSVVGRGRGAAGGGGGGGAVCCPSRAGAAKACVNPPSGGNPKDTKRAGRKILTRTTALPVVVGTGRGRRAGTRRVRSVRDAVGPDLPRRRHGSWFTKFADTRHRRPGPSTSEFDRFAKGPLFRLDGLVDPQHLYGQPLSGFHAFAAQVGRERAASDEGFFEEGAVREVESLRLVEKGGEGGGEVGPERRELGLRLEEFRLVRRFRGFGLLCLGLLNFFDLLMVLFRLSCELRLGGVPAGPVAFGQTVPERVVNLFREFVGPELVRGGRLCEFVLEREAQPRPRRTELLIGRLAVDLECLKLFRERVFLVGRVQALLQALEGLDVGEFELCAFGQEFCEVGGEGSFEREAQLDGVERGGGVARLRKGVGVQRHGVKRSKVGGPQPQLASEGEVLILPQTKWYCPAFPCLCADTLRVNSGRERRTPT